jgi:hypothetical protein
MMRLLDTVIGPSPPLAAGREDLGTSRLRDALKPAAERAFGDTNVITGI